MWKKLSKQKCYKSLSYTYVAMICNLSVAMISFNYK